MKQIRVQVAVAVTAILAGCSSGGGPAKCGFGGSTVLAPSAWPKFRRDAANTGRIDLDLHANPGTARLFFPPEGTASSAIVGSPIIGDDRIVIAAADGTVSVVDFAGERILDDDIKSGGAVTGSPLIGLDGTLFVGAGDGILTQYEADGTLKRFTRIGGFIGASPNIGADGTIYIGSESGVFAGVCPNGVARFLLSIAPMTSTAAVANDPEDSRDRIIVMATESAEVRALDIRGRQRWSFFTAAAVRAAVMLDEAAGRFFAADIAGRVYAGNLSDGRQREFRFEAAGSISASLALGRDDRDVLYAGDEQGTLFAIDRATGTTRWTYATGGTILSSPAVAIGGENDVVVFGADVPSEPENPASAASGIVYAVEDAGDQPALLWAADLGTAIGHSSPAIASDGTVYIGTQSGVVYAIGAQPGAENM